MPDISLLQIPSSTISVAVFCDTTRTMKGKLTDFGTPRLLTIPHINSETNSPPPIINVVCKYLRQFLDASFRVATLPICYNIE